MLVVNHGLPELIIIILLFLFSFIVRARMSNQGVQLINFINFWQGDFHYFRGHEFHQTIYYLRDRNLILLSMKSIYV